MRSGKRRRSWVPWPGLETIIVCGLVFKLALSGLFLRAGPGPGEPLFEPRPAVAAEEGAPAEGSGSEVAVPAELALSEKYQKMLEVVRAREEELKRKEERLQEKEKALAALEEDLKKRLAEQAAAQARLSELIEEQKQLIQKQKVLRTARIEHLVAAYGAMRPENAGRLVNSLEDEVAVGILSAMQGRVAGKILAFVDPDKAARLTKMISRLRQGEASSEEEKPAAAAAAGR